MDAITFNKKRLPSRHITDGAERVPHRFSYYAMGLMDEKIHASFVGVVSCWNEVAPRNGAPIRQGKDVTVGDAADAIGQQSADNIPDEDLREHEGVACPSVHSCGSPFTADTMACVSEAIGLALPGSASGPTPYESRDRFAYESGRAVMQLIAQNVRPRDIVTPPALENAAMIAAASSGSTSAALHLPAIAHEAGIGFDLFDVAEIFRKTPHVADRKPDGRFMASDMYEVGGMSVLLRTLLDDGFLHGDCITITARTRAGNLEGTAFSTEDRQGGEILRYEGPRGRPGIREMRSTTTALNEQGAGEIVALTADGPFSGGMRGCCIGHFGTEAAVGGPVALVNDGDMISVDAESLRFDLEADGDELEWRRSFFKPSHDFCQSGVLWKYDQSVGSAWKGAVTHPGAKQENVCYADQ
jgi:dihydroxy-acid dehydratase